MLDSATYSLPVRVRDERVVNEVHSVLEEVKTRFASEGTRRTARTMLRKLARFAQRGDPVIVEALLHLYENNEHEPRVRVGVVRALTDVADVAKARDGGSSVVWTLLKSLESRNKDERYAAAEALLELVDPVNAEAVVVVGVEKLHAEITQEYSPYDSALEKRLSAYLYRSVRGRAPEP